MNRPREDRECGAHGERERKRELGGPIHSHHREPSHNEGNPAHSEKPNTAAELGAVGFHLAECKALESAGHRTTVRKTPVWLRTSESGAEADPRLGL